MAEQQAEKSGGMFSDYSFIINSPLEPSVLNFIKFKSNIIEILDLEFTAHLFLIYLVVMLIFIFTIKFVVNKEWLLNKANSLPLGKYISYVLNKIITSWEYSSIFWIYFILFVILFTLLGCTQGIYSLLSVLK